MAYAASVADYLKQHKLVKVLDASASAVGVTGFELTANSNVQDLSGAGTGFDAALCCGTTLTALGDQAGAALKQLTSTLRPQGHVVIDYSGDAAAEKKLYFLLSEAGLECMRTQQFGAAEGVTTLVATKQDLDNLVSGTENLYAQMQEIYRKVWDPRGRMCWGYFPTMSTTFLEAGDYHVDRFAEMCKFTKDSKVLDIGCGNGNSIITIALRYGCEIVGVDPTVHCIETARKRCAEQHPELRATFLPVLVAPENEGGFTDAEFTHVWSNNSIGYVPVEERDAFWKEVMRVLKPGGTLCFDDILMPCATYEDGKWGGDEKLSQDALNNFYRRLHFVPPLASVETYDKFLPTLGLQRVMSENLAIHQRQSYMVVRERASALGYHKLSDQYNESVKANERGEVGWGMFIYTKP